MANTMMPAKTISVAAIGTLTVTTKTMATNVATHGGSAFQTNMFSKV
jgi:hypothetical protein